MKSMKLSNNLLRKRLVPEEEREIYADMGWWTKIRLEMLRGKVSIKERYCDVKDSINSWSTSQGGITAI